MTGLLVKLVMCPVGVIIAWMLFPNVDFTAWYQPIILGVILAVVGHSMEIIMLTENTIGLSTFMDFVASFIIVYFVSMFFVYSTVTFWGAILTSALLGVSEMIQHRWLVRSGRAEKNLQP